VSKRSVTLTIAEAFGGRINEAGDWQGNSS
jgi:hypothetical protein